MKNNNMTVEEIRDIIDNSSEDSHKLLNKAYENIELFDDMVFDEDSITGKLRELSEGELAELSPTLEAFSYTECVGFKIGELNCKQAAGEYNALTRTITIPEQYADEDYILLHEMIHAHEHLLDELHPVYREGLFLCLMEELKGKIDNLDELLLSFTRYSISTEMANSNTHSALFVLKSLDLDLKMGYELGTVYAYGGLISDFIIE